MDQLKKVEYIIVHHTQRNEDSPSWVRFRHKYNREWEDIGYHFLIGNPGPYTEDGKLYEGRSEELVGAHALGHNKNSIGICLIGDFDVFMPSEKQLKTLILFLREKIKQYGIPVENVKGHRELPNVKKTCPGKNVDMDYVRDAIKTQ